MSHRFYHTEGLILAHRHYGEADTFYQFLSPDLGLVTASARGIRYLKSKLRPQLEVLGHLELSLVRGRDLWRLVAAEKTTWLAPIFACPEKLLVWSRIAGLVRRLVHGEEKNPELFFDLKSGLGVLGQTILPEAGARLCELALALRLLYRLGYVKNEPALALWLDPDFWRRRDPSSFPDPAQAVTAAINRGLISSQL